jgi:hypothetical protein
VVVWQVADTASAIYSVDDFTAFVTIQTETAVRHIASNYPYDNRGSGALSLRDNAEEITRKLSAEITARVAPAARRDLFDAALMPAAARGAGIRRSAPGTRARCRWATARRRRIPGADINPYLAYTGLLAAGLTGVEQRIEPDGGVDRDNAYSRAGLPPLPRTLDESIDAFAASQFTREHLGDAVVDHIANFASQERDAARGAVTDWDRRRLFDI